MFKKPMKMRDLEVWGVPSYLVPLRSLAEEKYHHFRELYADCNINTLISSRDRREDDPKEKT